MHLKLCVTVDIIYTFSCTMSLNVEIIIFKSFVSVYIIIRVRPEYTHYIYSRIHYHVHLVISCSVCTVYILILLCILLHTLLHYCMILNGP